MAEEVVDAVKLVAVFGLIILGLYGCSRNNADVQIACIQSGKEMHSNSGCVEKGPRP